MNSNLSAAEVSGRSPVTRIVLALVGAAAIVCLMVFAVASGVHGWEYEKRLTGDYSIIAVNDRRDMNVSKMLPSGDAVGVIPKTVFAVGWNDDFIIAKRHAPPGHPSSLIGHATLFHILRVSDGATWGPFSQEQFEAERVKLGLPQDLRFTVSFRDLE
jgi:hypothetical protein